jgi:nitroreductase
MSDTPTAPPLLHAIATRRSLRAFADLPVSDEQLAVLFEAARWAPSGGNGQPWRFVVTRRGDEAFDRLAATLRPGNAAWAPHAPVLIAAAAKTVWDDPGKPVRPNRRALLDLGLALENLLLQAAHDGLMAHPMAGFDVPEASSVLQIDDKHEAIVLLALGHPGNVATLPPEVRAKDERPRRRRPLSDFVYQDRWGEPAGLTELDRSAADTAGTARTDDS